MNNSKRFAAGLGAAWLIAGVAGVAVGSDGTDAATRLAEAREAYERALSELRAAEAELAAARAETGVGRVSDEAAASGVVAQPETDAPPAETEARDTGFLSWEAWDKSIDIGINGSSGNSEIVNARVQLAGERITETMETRASALYRVSKQDGETSENRFRFDVLNDWIPRDSKIRWWAKGAYEFDEFQAWDHRLSASAGLGYEFVDNDKHTLVGRAGFGGSQTFGDDDEDFRPELVLGLDYRYRIADNQTFTAGTEYLLDVSDTENWRTNTFAQYEAVIDESSGMNFKTGVSHRYDSSPGGDTKKNDLEYFATLGWKF